MITPSFEIYGRGFGWSWRLRTRAGVVATGGHHHKQSREARQDVDRVRAAVVTLTGDETAFVSTDIGKPRALVVEDSTPGGDLPPDRDNWAWRVETPDRVLAHSADRFSTERDADTALDSFLDGAAGALPMFLIGAEYEWKNGPRSIEVGRPSLTGLVRELIRGIHHRKTLDRIDTRIVVAGSRGKSSTARRLDDVFNRRDFDTLTKITGNHPTLIHNGELHPIERLGPRTTLYENISVIGEFAPELDHYSPDDVAIFENQGITEYTTRLINRQLFDPTIVVLTNVRQDHNDTLGKTRTDIARSLARSVPSGAHVVSGEQHPTLHEYMREEIERRGGTIEQCQHTRLRRERRPAGDPPRRGRRRHRRAGGTPVGRPASRPHGEHCRRVYARYDLGNRRQGRGALDSRPGRLTAAADVPRTLRRRPHSRRIPSSDGLRPSEKRTPRRSEQGRYHRNTRLLSPPLP